MSKIRKLYYFDKKNAEEMISFLNDSINDNYINRIMFNPFLPLHYFLPLKLKFLPESFILKEGKDIKGLITVGTTKSKSKKVEIQKLFFEENDLYSASELIQFAVSKYKAMGAVSVLVKIDDYLPELLTLFVSKCGFSQISYEKLWRINKFNEKTFNKKVYRAFRNSDAKSVTSLYNDSLLPHFRPLLSKEVKEFKEPFFKGLECSSEYKYVIEDRHTKTIIGCIIIKTSDNENFIIDIIQTSWVNLDIDEILSYATYQIKKRKKKFGIFVKSKRYTTQGENYENKFLDDGYECVQSQIVLTNSSAKVLRNIEKTGKFIVINDFFPTKPISTYKL